MSSPAFSLPAELTVYTAADVHAQWLTLLPQWPTDIDVQVQAADVEQIDAAGLQLLASLRRSLHRRGQALLLVQPSETLERACRAFGFDSWLEQAAGEPA